MSQARILAFAFIVVGVLLALLSVFADVFFGSRGTTFGWKQLLGVVLGVVIAAAGVVLLRQEDGEYEDDEEADEEYVETAEMGGARADEPLAEVEGGARTDEAAAEKRS